MRGLVVQPTTRALNFEPLRGTAWFPGSSLSTSILSNMLHLLRESKQLQKNASAFLTKASKENFDLLLESQEAQKQATFNN